MGLPSGVIKRGKSSNWRFPAGETHGMGGFSIRKVRLLTTGWNGIPPWPMNTGTWWLWFAGIPTFLYKEDYVFKDEHWWFVIIPPFLITTSNRSLLNGAKKKSISERKTMEDHPSWPWQRIQIQWQRMPWIKLFKELHSDVGTYFIWLLILMKIYIYMLHIRII